MEKQISRKRVRHGMPKSTFYRAVYRHYSAEIYQRLAEALLLMANGHNSKAYHIIKDLAQLINENTYSAKAALRISQKFIKKAKALREMAMIQIADVKATASESYLSSRENPR